MVTQGEHDYTQGTGLQIKENTILTIRAWEIMGFPWDVPRATPSGYPSENPYSPSLEWHVHYIFAPYLVQCIKPLNIHYC